MLLGLRRSAREAPREQKASAAGPVIAFQAAGRPAWTPRDTASLTRSGFIGNPVGFRCVKMIAEAAAAVPLVLSRDGARYETHPLAQLLAHPNPAQSGPALFESFYGHLLLSGDGYLEVSGIDGRGRPMELHVLRSDRMRVVPGEDGWPVAYEYSVGARKARFDMRDGARPVLHLRAFHPQDDHYGMSALEAAASAVDVHNAASRWSKSLLDNAARPSGAIVYRGGDGMGQMASDQYTRLVEELESYHMGARNAGRPMLLEGGLDWKPMGFSPSDMEFHKTKEAAAREIALAFGVPPMLLGLPGDATYSNYQEANRAFYRLTVLPLVNRLLTALGGWLPEFYGERLTLSPELDSVPALAVEREALWRRVSEADFLSAAEKRALLGLPKAEEGSSE
ncbi:phage portal protein [Paroceanicella profunda]|uniref:Phage portal protein n=1 Tax=Paroceanicella profunda TaxID=2579971 RepID=A0A5B8FW60_9RHOB|nr:phage portal protein [Paroceanicella profunda]QDL93086.1 phage portal protein [Paroceanicella profunda]